MKHPLHHAVLIRKIVPKNGVSNETPVEPLFPQAGQSDNDIIGWFAEAIRSGKIMARSSPKTEYAWFIVKGELGHETWAGPGDVIMQLNGDQPYVLPHALAVYLLPALRHTVAGEGHSDHPADLVPLPDAPTPAE
jgi:hypothetical protein